ncbi:MAG TPA: VOC family protein [Streptosporangiaceae bacterium]
MTDSAVPASGGPASGGPASGGPGDGTLTRTQASDAVTGLGWRLLLGMLCTCVRVGSLVEAGQVAGQIVAAHQDAGESLRADIRHDRVLLTLCPATTAATTRETGLAHRISAFVRTLGLVTDACLTGPPRSVQVLEIGIDALDIAAIRPFWKAILGYRDEAEPAGPQDGIVDPLGQGPSVWFQQMDSPRPQRNRIHFDICVPHDEARHRIQATIAAGGTLLSDAEAPAFWVLADAEGNEACITTWQGRDP